MCLRAMCWWQQGLQPSSAHRLSNPTSGRGKGEVKGMRIKLALCVILFKQVSYQSRIPKLCSFLLPQLPGEWVYDSEFLKED